jgi:signal transduction histidine kinase
MKENVKVGLEKEQFKSIRNLRQRFNLRFKLILIVTVEILFSIILAISVDTLAGWLFVDFWKVPLWVDFVTISLLVGIFATNALTRWFIIPIKEIGAAMEKISEGDFTIRLETKSNSKEIKEIFSGFNMMAHELQSTEILKSDFVSNVSHEFKTPISAIEGYSMLLQNDDNLTPEQKEYVEKIVFNTQRLSSLTGSILLLSKIENQSIVSNKVNFDLDEQIRKSLLILESAWEQKNIEFDIDVYITNKLNKKIDNHLQDFIDCFTVGAIVYPNTIVGQGSLSFDSHEEYLSTGANHDADGDVYAAEFTPTDFSNMFRNCSNLDLSLLD